MSNWDDNTGEIGDIGPLTDSSASVFSLQYYKNKVLNYQAVLNALDAAVNSAWDLVANGADDLITQEIYNWLGEVDAKKSEIKLTSATINAGSNALSYAGVEFPGVNIPGGLAGLPFLSLPVIAAIGTAYVLSQWGVAAIDSYKQIAIRNNEIARVSGTPEQQNAALVAMAAADSAANAAKNPLGDTAKIVQYAAIALIAYFAFQTFNKGR